MSNVQIYSSNHRRSPMNKGLLNPYWLDDEHAARTKTLCLLSPIFVLFLVLSLHQP